MPPSRLRDILVFLMSHLIFKGFSSECEFCLYHQREVDIVKVRQREMLEHKWDGSVLPVTVCVCGSKCTKRWIVYCVYSCKLMHKRGQGLCHLWSLRLRWGIGGVSQNSIKTLEGPWLEHFFVSQFVRITVVAYCFLKSLNHNCSFFLSCFSPLFLNPRPPSLCLQLPGLSTTQITVSVLDLVGHQTQLWSPSAWHFSCCRV